MFDMSEQRLQSDDRSNSSNQRVVDSLVNAVRTAVQRTAVRTAVRTADDDSDFTSVLSATRAAMRRRGASNNMPGKCCLFVYILT